MSFPEPDESSSGNHGHPPNADAEMAAQKAQLLTRILSPDARMRLGNIRMVRPELANMVEQQLIGMATQGRIQSQLTDEQLRQLLYSLQQPKRNFKFNRV